MNGSLDERLWAYLDGELDEAERAALEAELGREPGAAARLESLRALEAALGALPRVAPAAGFDARFRARLERALGSRTAPLRIRVLERLTAGRAWLGAGALAGAAAAVALAVWLARPDPLGPELETVAEIGDPEAWDLLRSGDVELLEVLEILEAWDGVEES
jgi:anti-sigma factor RsiW